MTDHPTAVQGPEAPGAADAEEPQSILVVDDNPNSVVALTAVLERLQQRIVVAHSGAEALQQVLRTDFAVILMDVRMPQLDGLETAALIRQREKSAHTPIIFLTAAPRDEAESFKGYTLGAVDYLIKPLLPAVLLSKVGVLVELAKKNALLHQLNQALQAQAAQLAAANRELESFSSSVSHDLRAPLRAITGFSQLLVEKHAASLDETGLGYLNRIRQAGERMGELIDDLLLLAQVTRAPLERHTVDLGPIARDIVQGLASTQPKRRVTLQIAEHAVAEADGRLVRVILENLLGNAWKFTQRAPAAQIEVGQSVVEGERSYFVRDNGVGFDPTLSRQLFSPFVRLHTAEEFPGTGIGLAIVERIVTRHGGRVWAEAKLGEGAVFHFTLAPPPTPSHAVEVRMSKSANPRTFRQESPWLNFRAAESK